MDGKEARKKYSHLIGLQRDIEGDALILANQVGKIKDDIRDANYREAVSALESSFYTYRALRDLLTKLTRFLKENGELEGEIKRAEEPEELARLHMVRQMYHEQVTQEQIFVNDVLHELCRGEEVDTTLLKLKEKCKKRYEPDKCRGYSLATDSSAIRVRQVIDSLYAELGTLTTLCNAIIKDLQADAQANEIAIGCFAQALSGLLVEQDKLLARVEASIQEDNRNGVSVSKELAHGRLTIYIHISGREFAELRINPSFGSNKNYEYQMGFVNLGQMKFGPVEHVKMAPERIVDLFTAHRNHRYNW